MARRSFRPEPVIHFIFDERPVLFEAAGPAGQSTTRLKAGRSILSEVRSKKQAWLKASPHTDMEGTCMLGERSTNPVGLKTKKQPFYQNVFAAVPANLEIMLQSRSDFPMFLSICTAVK